MPDAEILNNYLQQVLKLKQQQYKHGNYLNAQQREALLAEVLTDVGFTADMNHLRKKKAEQAFYAYEFLKSDDVMRRRFSKIYQKYCQKYLKKALALDPYNEDFLEAYIDKSNDWKIAESYQYRYLALFNPNSSKYQTLILDLGLHNNEPTIDYLPEGLVSSLMEAMLDLAPTDVSKDTKPLQEAEIFREVIQEVGVEQETIQTLEEVLPGHLTTIIRGLRGERNWEGILKIYMSTEKVLAIAPYEPIVLLLTTFFYASVYPRILLSFHQNTDLIGKTDTMNTFFKTVFNKTQLNEKERVEEAKKSFQKSVQLKERYSKIVTALLLSEKGEEIRGFVRKPLRRFDLSSIDFVRTLPKMRGSLMLYSKGITSLRTEEDHHQLEEHLTQLEAFFEQEFLTFQVALNNPKLITTTKGSPVIGFICGLAIGAILYRSFPKVVFLMVAPIAGAVLENLFRQVKTKPKKKLTLLPFHKDNLAAL